MDIQIKNIQVVDKTSSFNGKTVNILVEKNVIQKISEAPISSSSIQEFDGNNLSISSGWVDAGFHYKDPGYEWLEDLQSVQAAAAYGGFTAVIGFPNTLPAVQTKEAISYFKNFSKLGPVQLLNFAAVTRNCAGEDFTDMIDLVKGGAVGFSDGRNIIDNSDIFLKTLLYLEPLHRILTVKCEDKYLSMYGQIHEGVTSTLLGLKGIPAAGEELMVARYLKLLEYSGIRSNNPILHFSTLSTRESIRLVRAAKAQGLPVSCDISAHHLMFTDDELINFDTNFKVQPPFRSKDDIEGLLEGIADDTIDLIVSDHNSWDQEHKNLEFDQAEFGTVGIQTVFPILLEKLGVNKTIEKISEAPRRVFGLDESKIEEGTTANLTIFSTNEVYTLTTDFLKSKGKNTPMLDRKLKGRAKAIYNNGYFKELN